MSDDRHGGFSPQGAPSTASAPYLPQSQRQELVASAARTAAQTLKLQGTSAPHIAGLGEGCDALGWDQALQLKVRVYTFWWHRRMCLAACSHIVPAGVAVPMAVTLGCRKAQMTGYVWTMCD
jgi:hypothetical protein